MSKRFVVSLVMLLSVVMLSASYASCEQIMTAEDFQNLCASAPESEVKQALEQMNSMALDITALVPVSMQNPDPGVITVLIDAIKSRAADIALNRKGTTALMYAAEFNVPEVVKTLVESGADVNIKDNDGKKALDYALKNEKIADNMEILKLLGYDAPMQSEEDKSPENVSNVSEDIETIEPEPEPASIDDFNDETNDTENVSDDAEPEISNNNAVSSKDVNILTKFIKLIEPFNKPEYLELESEDDSTSAEIEPSEPYEAVSSSDTVVKPENIEPVEPVEPVVDDKSGDVEPIEPKPVQESKIMPDEFMRMCSGASSEMILNAVENRNADVNARDYYDVTPLMYAAEKNSDPVVIDILVKHGAKVDLKDKDGKTALMYAAKSNPNPEIISALASNGTNVNARDNNRMTALMYAARNNNARVAKALIDAGAEELADKRGWTPLFWAARYTQDPEVIGVLLDAGHDPQIRAHDMATPIDHANKNPRLMNTKEFLRLEEESR